MGYWNCLASSRNRSALAGRAHHIFVPVHARWKVLAKEIGATISGLNLPGETLGAQHKQWQIGVRPARPAQTVKIAALRWRRESWHARQHLAKRLASHVTGTTAVKRKTAAQSGALHSQAESISVRVHGTKPPAGYSGAVYNAAQLQSLGSTGDSDEKRRAAVDIGISRILQMQRDNGGLRYGMKMGRKSLANGLRRWFLIRARASRDIARPAE